MINAPETPALRCKIRTCSTIVGFPLSETVNYHIVIVLMTACSGVGKSSAMRIDSLCYKAPQLPTLPSHQLKVSQEREAKKKTEVDVNIKLRYHNPIIRSRGMNPDRRPRMLKLWSLFFPRGRLLVPQNTLSHENSVGIWHTFISLCRIHHLLSCQLADPRIVYAMVQFVTTVRCVVNRTG